MHLTSLYSHYIVRLLDLETCKKIFIYLVKKQLGKNLIGIPNVFSILFSNLF